MPGQKRFEAHELRRLPVRISPAAQAILNTAHIQAKRLPLALSEHFGALPDVHELYLVVAVAQYYMPGAAKEAQMFVVTVKGNNVKHRYFLPVADVVARHESGRLLGLPKAQAYEIAQGLVASYPYR